MAGLGSNLARDSRVQVALNNASGGNSQLLFPLLHLIIQAFLPMPLKTQYDQRAKRFLFNETPSKTVSLNPSITESTLTIAQTR